MAFLKYPTRNEESGEECVTDENKQWNYKKGP